MSVNDNFIGTPWWVTTSGSGAQTDYTRHREPVSYTMDDLIGRKDYVKYTLTTTVPTTVSGEGTILV